MSTESNTFELTVLSGLHAGATARLDGKSHVVIGRDMACDIMLRDVCIADRHVMLVILEGKLSAVALADAVKIDENELALGKSRTLRNGTKIALGETLIGIGLPGMDWADAPEETKSSFAMRTTQAGYRWLSDKPLHRHISKLMILAIAGVCMMSALIVPLYQWTKHAHVPIQSDEALAHTLRQLLVSLNAGHVEVVVNKARRNVVVTGYVQREDERVRIEAAIASARLKPVLRIFSAERIEADAQSYLKRYLPSAAIRSGTPDAVVVSSAQSIRPAYWQWLSNTLLRDIPGVREVLYEGPSFDPVQQVSPAPYSLVSIGSESFLTDGRGERYFAGADIGRDLKLVRVGRQSVYVQRTDETSP